MRLSTIKLSGFKSFVDPTTLHLPTNMTGIVGPNGCGKSNIIDAVRWVMGESSASRLRGDSLTDVIFSGSSARKPVSQATVELIFDNSDHTISPASSPRSTRSRSSAWSAATATAPITSTAPSAGAATSPTCSWALVWGHAATRSSSRA